jgi:hypothetical protein
VPARERSPNYASHKGRTVSKILVREPIRGPLIHFRTMTSANQEHLRALLQASREERGQAVEALLISLDGESDEDVDQETWERSWAAELERRLADNDPGVPADEVFAAGRARLLERTRERLKKP